MTENQTCGTCVFSDRKGLDISKGVCRRNPPTIQVIPQMTQAGAAIKLQAMFVSIDLRDKGCGEYKPKIEEVT